MIEKKHSIKGEITEIEHGDTLWWSSKWWLFGDVMPESDDIVIIIKSSDSFSRQQLQVSFESGVKLLRRDHWKWWKGKYC